MRCEPADAGGVLTVPFNPELDGGVLCRQKL